MLGYHANVDLKELERQVLEEFDSEEPYSRMWLPQGSSRKVHEEPEAARELIGDGFTCLKYGERYDGYTCLKAASDLASRSLLSLVAGDLGCSVQRRLEAGECYARVKFCHPRYYREAVARQGRAYTAVLNTWRQLGLMPAMVITWGGEGADMYLVELVPDPDRKPTRTLTNSMKKRIAALGREKPMYIEMWVSTLLGEEFEDDEWPVYGASSILGMGPYIFSPETAVKVAKSYADELFREYDECAVATWRQMPELSDYESVAKRLRLPLHYFKFIQSNEALAKELVFGRIERRMLPWGDSWFDRLKSIEQKAD
jgi:hypothetical protein